MNSKRAKEIFTTSSRIGGTWYLIEQDAQKAVKLAEEDARERAVKAYCTTSRCLMIAAMRPPCEGECCNRAMEFLKTYDNEN